MTTVNSHSALFEGSVRHRRFLPRVHDFSYRIFMLYLDLAELDTLMPQSIWWSVSRSAVARFDRRHYLGDPLVPLDSAVRGLVAAETGQKPEGSIRMLTNAQYYGYCFNPVTFYYCFDKSGSRVETIVAEITNTPWKERHAYVLSGGDELRHGRHAFRFAKQFHVSPFMPMEQDYQWQFTDPTDHLSAHFENFQSGVKQFDATLMLKRRALTPSSLRRALLRYPFMTLKVIAAIHWQALRLFLKRTPFYNHPKHQTSANQVPS